MRTLSTATPLTYPGLQGLTGPVCLEAAAFLWSARGA